MDAFTPSDALGLRLKGLVAADVLVERRQEALGVNRVGVDEAHPRKSAREATLR